MEKLDKAAEKQETKSGFSESYEPFDPEKEVEKIGKFTNEELKNLTPQERLKIKEERLKIFKEKLAEQKSGIAKINAELESMIFDGADEVDIKKLQDYMQEKSVECKLSASQMFKYNAAFNEIQERNNAIGRVADKYSGKSGKEFFAAMFGWKPQGEVQIKRGPLSFFVICQDSNDYVALYNKSFGEGAALSTGFAKARTIIPELEDTINVAKAAGNSEARLEAARIHEDKHIFDNLRERMKSKRQELREKTNWDMARIERGVKTEALAYLGSGESPDVIKKLLLKKESEGGAYDYFERYKKYYSLPKYARFGKALLNETHSEFRNKYERDVGRALDIVARLEELGFTRDKIIGLLQTERLDQWGKIYERFALCQEFKSKKEEYIRKLDEGIKNATSELEKHRKQHFEGDDELTTEIERDISQLLDEKKKIEEIEILKNPRLT